MDDLDHPSHRVGPSISIVIPVRNEATCLPRVLAPLRGAGVELIVADGRSEDSSSAVAAAQGARVIASEPGRARQMNAGAAAASGDILLFLHADTRLPADFVRHVRATLAERHVVAGAFRLRFEERRGDLAAVERLANWRARELQLPYGDQAIFLRAETFRRIGGFASIPVMEDYALLRRLRRLGRIAIAPAYATTSARRYLAEGVWRTSLRHYAVVAGYTIGIAPDRLAAWRCNGAPPDVERRPGPQ